MKQITEKIEELKEIHVEKMHFRVISRHPQYSIDTANRIFEEQRKDLYNIFKKYVFLSQSTMTHTGPLLCSPEWP